MRKVGWILFLSAGLRTKVSAEEDEAPGRLTHEGDFFDLFFSEGHEQLLLD